MSAHLFRVLFLTALFVLLCLPNVCIAIAQRRALGSWRAWWGASAADVVRAREERRDA